MPLVGFGTYKFKNGGAQRAVTDALIAGYRHIDTAFCYGGEKTEIEVGKALKSSSCPVARSEIFLTTKHWRAYHGYAEATQCLDLSLKRLGVSYVDLYLMHWPGPAYHTMGRSKAVIEASPLGAFVYARKGHERENMKALRGETWRAMEDALKAGKCRAIGVSNFTVEHLQALKETASVWPPAVNQVELHPYRNQAELRRFCEEEGIAVQAYASLGGQDAGKGSLEKLGGSLLSRPEVLEIVGRHSKAHGGGVTAAGVLLRWATQRGIAVLPKSSTTQRMAENLAAATGFPAAKERQVGGAEEETTSGQNTAEWKLTEKDLAALDALDQSGDDASRLCWARDPLKLLGFE